MAAGNGAYAEYERMLSPKMDAARVVQGENWRIGVITNALLRFEWSDTGVFEDRPTQVVANRNVAPVDDIQLKVEERDGRIILDTGELYVTYDQKPFSKEGLSVVVKHLTTSQFNTWHYGDAAPGNLRGTTRTLDTINGRTELEEGIISRDGWAILDDSRSNVVSYEGADPKAVFGQANINAGGWRVVSRAHAGANGADGAGADGAGAKPETDFYFFGYAHEYKRAIHDFYALTGPQPLLPRWALGNWWSRYFAYTQDEYLKLHDRFKKEGIPFTTAVIDMDWHITNIDPKYGYGWTGYTWNEDLFPDHVQFLHELDKRGLKNTLNVHPRDGVRGYEKPYAELATKVGIDPATDEAVEFDLTSPAFMNGYFDMHHELEDEGVDFWWLDWQQGGVTRQPGLDPLWMLNHVHYIDSARDGKWPLTFSRYAGPGSHRYPVGFSGDSIVSWESLQFQPEFTATASNIGFGWWSHDIGGHMMGYRDDELEARWYQYGVFSPINRLHSSNSAFTSKEPWNFRREVRDAMVQALQLRHRLIPFLHTMNYRAHTEGEPLVQPMYWNAPESAGAYEVPQEFWFGPNLVMAPIISPSDKSVAKAKADVWLPAGEWFDVFSGRRYVSRDIQTAGIGYGEGNGGSGRKFEAWRALDRQPLFAQAGTILPLAQLGEGQSINSVANPSAFEVVVFPDSAGEAHEFTLVEDNGSFEDAREGRVARTRFTWNGTELVISAVSGDAAAVAAVPQAREWTVTLRGVADLGADGVRVEGAGADGAGSGVQVVAYAYDEDTMSASYTLSAASVAQDVRVVVTVEGGAQPAPNPVAEDTRKMLLGTQIAYNMKEAVYRVAQSNDPAELAALGAQRFDYEYGLHGDSAEHSVGLRIPAEVESALKEIMLRS
ncbi:glycoside hydrolase family 31 protein [Alloscardovia macacae]|uniref:Glycosyl hydrolase, family 31 n=1 Tax=Alloscardovia macacae TaxID=1160091 RepID=A0A261F038_9BIFI|nr:glycoside hydrolase family 31 protein [Alloscardovia macacae]OZG52467.1 glycosyl hydrolase, family 31 [Alloscardovia macacae]